MIKELELHKISKYNIVGNESPQRKMLSYKINRIIDNLELIEKKINKLIKERRNV